MADCSSCSASSSCSKDDKSACQVVLPHAMTNIKHVIGVMSGKGGVGKSTVAANLGVALMEMGYKVGILDADITGPSIPRILGLENERALMYPEGLRAIEAPNGIKAMSLNFLIEEEKKPVIWRGPIITNTVKQFYQEVIWGDLDFLLIDMPPGTGDVTLTVMQSLPLDGVVMVSLPQDMVSMIVSKAIDMSRQLGVNVLGVVENMSYMSCPHCDEKIRVFKTDGIANFLSEQQVELLCELPIVQDVATIHEVEEATKVQFNDLANVVSNKVISAKATK